MPRKRSTKQKAPTDQALRSRNANPIIKIEPGIQASNQKKECFWYVVSEGPRAGIYNHESGAIHAVTDFGGQNYCKYKTRAEAIDHLRSKDFLDSEIRTSQNPFAHHQNYEPDPQASFIDEIKRLSSSQHWTKHEFKQGKTDCLRAEIILHYLPGGVRLKSEDRAEDKEQELDDDETLLIYQGMCKTAGKTVHDNILACTVELNSPPFVNIIDFVDTYRTGQQVSTFDNWLEFKEYTLPDRTIDVKSAKQSIFLEPLLQNFKKKPIKVNKWLEGERLRNVQPHESEVVDHTPFKIDHDLHRSLSPSVFDRLSSPPCPALQPISENRQRSTSLHAQVKIEPLNSSAPQPDRAMFDKWPNLRALTPAFEISDSELLELSYKIEAATQVTQVIPSSPFLASEISESDLIEASMRFEAATQVPTTTTEKPLVSDQPSTAPVANSKKRARGSPPSKRRKRNKRQRDSAIE